MHCQQDITLGIETIRQEIERLRGEMETQYRADGHFSLQVLSRAQELDLWINRYFRFGCDEEGTPCGE